MSESMLRGEGPGTPSSRVTRWLIPGLMVVVGSALMVGDFGMVAAGIGLTLVFGSGVVIFAGWFGRLNDDSERIREQEARDEFERTGRWPDRD